LKQNASPATKYSFLKDGLKNGLETIFASQDKEKW
jgi:hypothetical protein